VKPAPIAGEEMRTGFATRKPAATSARTGEGAGLGIVGIIRKNRGQSTEYRRGVLFRGDQRRVPLVTFDDFESD